MSSPGLRASNGYASGLRVSAQAGDVGHPCVQSPAYSSWQEHEEGDVGELLQRRLSCGAAEPAFIPSQPGEQRVDSQEQTLAPKTPYRRRLEGWSRPGDDFPLLHLVTSFLSSLCLGLSGLGPFLQCGAVYLA